MRYLPCGSDSTLTVMRVFALRACTNAPRNGALSGPVTVPLIVAAGAASLVERSKRAATTPIDNHVNDRMASSPVSRFALLGRNSTTCAGRHSGRDFCKSALTGLRGRHLPPIGGEGRPVNEVKAGSVPVMPRHP